MRILDVARVRTIAGTEDVEVVTDVLEVVVVGDNTRDPLSPRTILRIAEQYLVETHDAPDNWYMGQLAGTTIVCHGAYGRLEDAIRGL